MSLTLDISDPRQPFHLLDETCFTSHITIVSDKLATAFNPNAAKQVYISKFNRYLPEKQLFGLRSAVCEGHKGEL